MDRLNRDAEQLAARFQLKYRAIEAERANVKRRYGICFSDGTIRIRLRHVATRKPLKYSSLVNTLCHELAHLTHFNHGPNFQTLYAEILEWARRENIYQPRAPKVAHEHIGAFASHPLSASASVDEEAPRRGPVRKRRDPSALPAAQLELFG